METTVTPYSTRNKIAVGLTVLIMALAALALYQGNERPHLVFFQTVPFLFLVARLVYKRDPSAPNRTYFVDVIGALTGIVGIILLFAKY